MTVYYTGAGKRCRDRRWRRKYKKYSAGLAVNEKKEVMIVFALVQLINSKDNVSFFFVKKNNHKTPDAGTNNTETGKSLQHQLKGTPKSKKKKKS